MSMCAISAKPTISWLDWPHWFAVLRRRNGLFAMIAVVSKARIGCLIEPNKESLKLVNIPESDECSQRPTLRMLSE